MVPLHATEESEVPSQLTHGSRWVSPSSLLTGSMLSNVSLKGKRNPDRSFHYGPAVCFQGPPGQCVKTTVEILKNNSLDLIPELYLLFRALVHYDLCKHCGPLCSILVDTFSV